MGEDGGWGDDRARRIYNRLVRFVGPVADFFREAVCMTTMSNPPTTAVHTVMGHIREVESALRDVIVPLVDRSVASDDEQGNHAREIREMLCALDIDEASPVGVAWLELAGQGGAPSLATWAHRRGLEDLRRLDPAFYAMWDKVLKVFDAVLPRVEAHFLSYIDFLDRLLAKKQPSKDDIKLLYGSTPPSFEIRRYFFVNLDSPEWLPGLRKKGFFKRPPSAVVTPEQRAYPSWPESAYLARMATKAPELVHDIILEMDETDNIYVVDNLVQAALEMPASLAASLVNKLIRLLDTGGAIAFPDKVGQLAAHLAEGGQPETAMELARWLLRLTRGEGQRIGRCVNARFNTWHYGELLSESVPTVVEHAKQDALEMLCDLLDSGLEPQDKEEESLYDRSYVWCDAVEDDPDTRIGSDERSLLVAAVRDAAERLIKDGTLTLDQAVQVFTARQHPIYKRLVMHVLRTCEPRNPSLLSTWLMRREVFEYFHAMPMHEYTLLLRDCFVYLMPEDQATLLSWIDAGPNRDKYKERRARRGDVEPTEDEIDADADRWRLGRLQLIKQALPSDRLADYEELESKYGDARPLDAVRPLTAAARVPASPKPADEVSAMSIPEVACYVKEWVPDDDFWGPSAEGLGRILAQDIAIRPDAYASQARLFFDVDPTYVRQILDGLRQAAKEGKAFDWEPVLELGGWIVRQPREIPGRTVRHREWDPDWGWARQALVDLLEAGCNKNLLPFASRETAWPLLEHLAEDPSPTPEEDTPASDRLDPATKSINTVRGGAMHAVIEYALWVLRNLDEQRGTPEGGDHSLDDMPEVRGALKKHLDTAHDPTVTIRSVYGRWFPWLCLLDPQWAKENVERIFPHESDERYLRNAAWDTYIVYCEPYNSVFTVLRDEYVFAVHNIGGTERMTSHMANPDERLAEHLMVFYGRGVTNLEEHTDLIPQFFENADDELRSHAMDFIGRSLQVNDGERADQEIVDRMRQLWEWRIDHIRASGNVAAFRQELSAFGWWFFCGAFEQNWALERLREAMEMANNVEPDHQIVEMLADLADEHPALVVECFRHLLDGGADYWRVSSWIKGARRALETAVSRPESRQAALDLANAFGAAGYIDEFRDLAG